MADDDKKKKPGPKPKEPSPDPLDQWTTVKIRLRTMRLIKLVAAIEQRASKDVVDDILLPILQKRYDKLKDLGSSEG